MIFFGHNDRVSRHMASRAGIEGQSRVAVPRRGDSGIAQPGSIGSSRAECPESQSGCGDWARIGGGAAVAGYTSATCIGLGGSCPRTWRAANVGQTIAAHAEHPNRHNVKVVSNIGCTTAAESKPDDE